MTGSKHILSAEAYKYLSACQEITTIPELKKRFCKSRNDESIRKPIARLLFRGLIYSLGKQRQEGVTIGAEAVKYKITPLGKKVLEKYKDTTLKPKGHNIRGVNDIESVTIAPFDAGWAAPEKKLSESFYGIDEDILKAPRTIPKTIL